MTNTFLSRVDRSEMGPDLGSIWDTLNGLTGEPAFVEVFANAPDLLNLVMGEFYGKIFFGGTVDNKYKQLARLYLSKTHGCLTCNYQNVPGSLEAGVTQAQVDAIMDFETGPFDDAEKAVLRYTAQMTLTNPEGYMSEKLHTDLRAHFTDPQICELGVVMAIIGGMAKLSFVLDLVEKEPYCAFANPE